MILAVTIGPDAKTIQWEDFFKNITNITREQHKESIRKFYELIEDFINDEVVKAKN